MGRRKNNPIEVGLMEAMGDDFDMSTEDVFGEPFDDVIDVSVAGENLDTGIKGAVIEPVAPVQVQSGSLRIDALLAEHGLSGAPVTYCGDGLTFKAGNYSEFFNYSVDSKVILRAARRFTGQI